MKYPALKLSSIIIIAFAVASCGHTNKLAEHNIRAQTVNVHAIGGISGTAEANIPADSSHHRSADLASTLGSSVISNETAQKLNRAANSDSLASAVSLGFSQAITMFLDMRPVDESRTKADYIAETKLVSYSLTSGSTGISAHISALSRIIQRSTGEVVWSYGTTNDVPLITTVPQAGQGMVLGAVNAGTLSQMTEEEIAEVFRHAAINIGATIGETLREDVAELAKK